MSNKVNSVKREQWAERLGRFPTSGQTVAQFCQTEGVSMPSFYQWKRKLRGDAQERQVAPWLPGRLQPAQSTTSGFKPVWIATPLDACAATVRLPSGIVIELSRDPQIIEQVVGQLLAHSPDTGADAC